MYPCTYSHGEGGRGVRWISEKVREALVHKRFRKYQHDRLYLQSKKTTVKTTFRVWCLYRYGIWSMVGAFFCTLHLVRREGRLHKLKKRGRRGRAHMPHNLEGLSHDKKIQKNAGGSEFKEKQRREANVWGWWVRIVHPLIITWFPWGLCIHSYMWKKANGFPLTPPFFLPSLVPKSCHTN
jgi:hypothetical protein